MTRYNAIAALAPDDRPPAMDHAERAYQEKKARVLHGVDLAGDQIEDDIKAAEAACITMRRAAAAGDHLQVNAAALDIRRHLRKADALAIAIQRGEARHLNRRARVRT